MIDLFWRPSGVAASALDLDEAPGGGDSRFANVVADLAKFERALAEFSA